MNRKHVGRFLIVLFLLAALPGMTAVMAQGQEPAEKNVAPAVVTVVSETPNIHYTDWESEPNNTMAQADVVDYIDAEVWGAGVYNGDVDWYKFYVNAVQTSILINTDAQLDGESTDTVVKLYDSAGNLLSQNDDMGTGEHDSLLFAVNQNVGWYYVQVSDFGSPCATDCNYEVIIGRGLLVSAAAANLGTGYVDGIPFRSEDVLALTPLDNDFAGNPQHKWVMLMDGSDVGITKGVVNIGLGWPHYTGSLTLSFAANMIWQDYQGINRTFKPWDWAEVEFARMGPNTLLEYSNGYPYVEYKPGTNHGLTTKTEKVDALDVNVVYAANPAWTVTTFMSTVGAAAVPTGAIGSVKAADEDLIRGETWTGLGWWYNDRFFDGSTVPGLAIEDVVAADFEPSTNRLFLTILGNGNVLSHAVTQKDMFWLEKSGNSWVWGGLWHFPNYGWNYNLDAIDSGGN